MRVSMIDFSPTRRILLMLVQTVNLVQGGPSARQGLAAFGQDPS